MAQWRPTPPRISSPSRSRAMSLRDTAAPKRLPRLLALRRPPLLSPMPPSVPPSPPPFPPPSPPPVPAVGGGRCTAMSTAPRASADKPSASQSCLGVWPSSVAVPEAPAAGRAVPVHVTPAAEAGEGGALPGSGGLPGRRRALPSSAKRRARASAGITLVRSGRSHARTPGIIGKLDASSTTQSSRTRSCSSTAAARSGLNSQSSERRRGGGAGSEGGGRAAH
mmetsp:Transcript_38184/g.120246  ORF Transcript_38184/g.120246 Transcript_38184/m.120246 type:complete len:223 (-) Transcript_38184:281-949(-)